jgi:hypothetical protein
MNAELYNNYWISSDTYLTQEHRDHNAILIYQYLFTLGWTKEAIAGILGNMDVESSMNPALIEGRGYPTLPDNNTVLAITTQTGVGLVQWTGTTPTQPAGQKLASFAIRYNKNWYDGELQCFRLKREYEEDLQFDSGTVDGVYYDWQVYISSHSSPAQLAKVWQYLYERGGSDTQTRQQKAEYYYRIIGTKAWLFYMMANRRKEYKRRWQRI